MALLGAEMREKGKAGSGVIKGWDPSGAVIRQEKYRPDKIRQPSCSMISRVASMWRMTAR